MPVISRAVIVVMNFATLPMKSAGNWVGNRGRGHGFRELENGFLGPAAPLAHLKPRKTWFVQHVARTTCCFQAFHFFEFDNIFWCPVRNSCMSPANPFSRLLTDCYLFVAWTKCSGDNADLSWPLLLGESPSVDY